MRVVLCGLGRMGWNHFRVLVDHPDVQLVGVVDADAARAEQAARRAAGAQAFTRLDEALERLSPDACIVAASTIHHRALGEIVLSRMIPLLLEKPIAKTVAEGEELCRLAEQSGTTLMIGHVERFNPGVVTAKQLLARGQIGDCIHIAMQRVGGSPRDLLAAGDVLVDLAVHDIDIAHWLAGAPRLLHAAGHKSTTIDAASLVLKAGPALVDLHCNWLTPVKIRRLQITGTQGLLDVNLITQRVTMTRTNETLLKLEDAPNLPYSEYLRSFAEPDQVMVGSPSREPLRDELSAFVSCVQKREPPPITARDALLALEIAEAARMQVEASALAA